MLTRPTSELPLSSQGPHTVAHSLVSHGIQTKVSGNSWQELQDLFDAQVPEPAAVQALLLSEISATNKLKFGAHLKRYADDYEILFGTVMAGLEEEDDDDFDAILGAIRQLMEMHPFQTYSWKSGKRASNKSTGGKKEAMHKKNFLGGDVSALKGLIDRSRAKFKEDEQFLQFLRTRLLLVATSDQIDTVL